MAAVRRAVLVATAACLLARVDAATPAVLVERVVYLMGTRARLVVAAPTRADAHRQLDAMIGSLEATETELTTWRPSAFAALAEPSAAPRPVGNFCRLLSDLARWHADTGGVFDPAIAPVLDAWGIGHDARIPSEHDLAIALRRSGFRRLGFDAAACTVAPAPGVRLDSGGFGKGEALDRLASIHAGDPIGWMADLGGQIAFGGTAPAAAGWDVGLADARDRTREISLIRVASGSLATSAGSERDTQVSGRRVGHILNPATGEPASFRGSVTIWHARALVADILSTALFVMGPSRGLAWADRRDIAACVQLETRTPAEPPALRASRAFVRRFPGACGG